MTPNLEPSFEPQQRDTLNMHDNGVTEPFREF